jgi:FlaA1/EpsC-like NDP-sugar epimerase
LDRDSTNHGDLIGGIPILGSIAQLPQLAAQRRATEVVVISGSMSGKELRQVIGHCDAARLNLKIIPPLSQLFDGNGQIPLKAIEITDLLRRDPVQLDTAALKKLFEGTTVFVTGAGGSIAIARFSFEVVGVDRTVGAGLIHDRHGTSPQASVLQYRARVGRCHR